MLIKFIIFLFLAISLIIQSEWMLLFCSLVYCMYYILQDFWPLRINRLDISSVYPIGLLLNTTSHIIAITSDDPFIRYNYLLRYLPQHLFTGLAVFHIGSLVIMETLRYNTRPLYFEKEKIQKQLSISWSSTLWLVILVFFISQFIDLSAFGSVGNWLKLLVMGGTFYLSLYANYYNSHEKINLLLVLVAFLSLWSLRFSYLRYEIILPWIAYFLGEAIARKRFGNFTVKSKIIVLLLLLIIPPVFTYLGQNRAEITGREDKLSLVLSGSQKEEELANGQTIMSRLSYINQLTHVAGLIEKNGFYEGKTLFYFAYVFIPRFIWPEKPTIQQGQWFALETGLAYKLKTGRANNSINMTVPGEFYLNFGWPGVLIGCWLFGLFIVFIWHGVQGSDLPSWGLKFYLLFGSMAGLGADLQIIVTLTAYYLIYKLYEIFIAPKFQTVRS